MSVKISVPPLGESVTEATVSAWYKSAGDAIGADEMLCELETDKVSVEVPSPIGGVLTEIFAQEGETIGRDAVLALVEAGANGAVDAPPKDAPSASAPAPASASAPEKDASPAPANAPVASGGRTPEDAPSAKRLMAEKGIARDAITPSGRDGRVMKGDVLDAVKNAPATPPPAQARDTRQDEERVPMTRLRQTIAKRLKDSQNTAATLTTYNEVDMSTIIDIRRKYKEQFEKKHGIKLGFMSFFVKACCHALKEIPEINAEISGTDIIYKNYVNMGIAVGIPSGLVVPVIYGADKLQFAEIEKEIIRLSTRAHDGKLSMQEMQGGSFTISNGGVYGSLMSSPILNPPQSGILGMHKIQERPVAVNGELTIRPMMYIALSYDHRIIDGKGSVTFLVRVKELLEEPHLLMMDI